jgi:hypothetical protein
VRVIGIIHESPTVSIIVQRITIELPSLLASTCIIIGLKVGLTCLDKADFINGVIVNVDLNRSICPKELRIVDGGVIALTPLDGKTVVFAPALLIEVGIELRERFPVGLNRGFPWEAE